MMRKIRALKRVIISTFLSFSFKNRREIIKLSHQKLPKLVLFVISPADLNSPSNAGRFPDKIYDLHRISLELGLRSQIIFHPWESTKFNYRSVPVLRIENMFASLSLMCRLHFRNRGQIDNTEFGEWKASNGLLGKLYYSVWESFINKVNPAIIIGIDLKDSLALVCKVRGIPLVEVMHGTFARESPPLKRHFNGAERVVPVSLFLSWDLHYSKVIEQLGISSPVMGHPNLHYSNYRFSCLDKPVNKILITLSWGVDNSFDPYGMMDVDLAKKLTGLDLKGFTFIFRMHPVASTSYSRKLGEIQNWFESKFPGVHLTISSGVSLYDNLLCTKLHITHNSSSFYEAGLMGVPTIFTSQTGFDSVPNYFKQPGGVYLWNDFSEIEVISIMKNGGLIFGNKLDIDKFSELILCLL